MSTSDTERKGHKRKLADVAGTSRPEGSEQAGESITEQVETTSLPGLAPLCSFRPQGLQVLSAAQATHLVSAIRAFTNRAPEQAERLSLRRTAHSLAELSKTGE